MLRMKVLSSGEAGAPFLDVDLSAYHSKSGYEPSSGGGCPIEEKPPRQDVHPFAGTSLLICQLSGHHWDLLHGLGYLLLGVFEVNQAAGEIVVIGAEIE